MNIPSSRAVFDELIATRGIRVARSDLFDRAPAPLPKTFDFGRIEGMMLGLAIGDALGNVAEGILPSDRTAYYDELRDYRTSDGRGYPSDDTQLAFWTLEQLIEDTGFMPANVAQRFAGGRIHGIGATVKQCLEHVRAGRPWHVCGPLSAGNGALMRIAPILIPHLRSSGPELWSDAALCAMITHNDSAAIASCVAFVKLLWELLSMQSPPAAEWWLESFVSTLKPLESDEYEPRCPALRGWRGRLGELLERELWPAYREGLTVRAACDRWWSGAYLLETVPAVLYILMRHATDPEQAIVRAVNDTRDNDTIGAIVGAAVGALHGRRGLPDRWVQQLSGRTREDDDGRVSELLAQAAAIWGGRAGAV